MPIPITIADDSALSRKTIQRALPPGWDVVVHEAKNGKEAIVAVESGLAEVLFLDLQMPEMDGYQVLSHIKEHHEKAVVIVISADIQPEAQAMVSALGAFRFLKKPLDGQLLAATLKELGLI
ncbi:chemotaxis protein CheY [Rheinheimera sp. KL1]|jgi:CheY-like chemotaxis protein|uniref:response regulator n=1 Tax=Rheinheimera sp. KL1 TaxID=1635005 RepID=UPI0006A9D6D4|nr:response regulator [Rheinheimera sp. KL1]KOO57835.1 chemotaxis protein CheY [Rheinheimera sp. KL1]